MRPIIEHDFTITWGRRFRLPFTWEQADETPVDLAAIASARCESRPAPGDSHVIVAFDTSPVEGEGRIHLGDEDDGDPGQIVLTLDEEQVLAVTREGVYDLWLYPVDPAAQPIKFSAGRQLLDKSITRPRAVPA